jgi:hypothetical protein
MILKLKNSNFLKRISENSKIFGETFASIASMVVTALIGDICQFVHWCR